VSRAVVDVSRPGRAAEHHTFTDDAVAVRYAAAVNAANPNGARRADVRHLTEPETPQWHREVA
jgi:hypothetical protein